MRRAARPELRLARACTRRLTRLAFMPSCSMPASRASSSSPICTQEAGWLQACVKLAGPLRHQQASRKCALAVAARSAAWWAGSCHTVPLLHLVWHAAFTCLMPCCEADRAVLRSHEPGLSNSTHAARSPSHSRHVWLTGLTSDTGGHSWEARLEAGCCGSRHTLGLASTVATSRAMVMTAAAWLSPADSAGSRAPTRRARACVSRRSSMAACAASEVSCLLSAGSSKHWEVRHSHNGQLAHCPVHARPRPRQSRHKEGDHTAMPAARPH